MNPNQAKTPPLFAALLVFASLISGTAIAGWEDLRFQSPESGSSVHQGGNITLTLTITNGGVADGGAAYISSVTLEPGPCINNGASAAVAGGIICPDSPVDIGCKFRFRNASQQSVYEFINLTMNESCMNGSYAYSFRVEGNTEVGAGGSFSDTTKSSSPSFLLTLIGPHHCGDGSCDSWKGEACSSCPADCGLCPQCEPGETICDGDSIATCSEGRRWVYSPCAAGCILGATGAPECIPPCAEGETQCVSGSMLKKCVSGRFRNESCPHGCAYDACRSDCESTGCPERCQSGTHYYIGECSRATGQCSYTTEICREGCTSNKTICLEAVPTPAPPSGGLPFGNLLLPAALLILVIAAAVYYLKFMNGKGRKEKEGGVAS